MKEEQITKKDIDDIFDNNKDIEYFLKLLNITPIKLEELMYNNELFQKILECIPDMLKNYYISKLIMMGYEDELKLNDVDKEKIYSEYCKKIFEIPTDEKIKTIKREYSPAVKLRIILTIDDEETKKKLIEELSDEEKSKAISSLTDDDKKIELMSYIHKCRWKSIVIASLKSDEEKIRQINIIEAEQKEVSKNQIYSISYLNYVEIIKSIDNDELKFKLLNEKYVMLKELKKEDPYSIELNSFEDGIGKILKSFKDSSYVEKTIGIFDGELVKKLRQMRAYDREFISNNIEKIMIKEGIDKKNIETIKRLFMDFQENNPKVCFTLDFSILDGTISNIFTREQLEQIVRYPDIQEKILLLKSSEKKIHIFKYFIEKYSSEYDDSRWNRVIEELLIRINSNEYAELINNIQEIDDDISIKLYRILQSDNYFNISNIEQLNDFERIKNRVCDNIIHENWSGLEGYPKIIEMSELERKQFAILEKLYGQDLETARNILKLYGEDAQNLSSNSRRSEICKKYIESLKIILNTTDEEKLNRLYNIEVQVPAENINTILIEKEIQSAYMREYNEVLFDPQKSQDKLIGESDGIKIYDAGVDFNILMTSVSAYNIRGIDDYKIDWNHVTNDFCGSFIRNDMLGTARIPYVCFGFSNMKENSLILSGPSNISSKARFFNTEASWNIVNFCTPNTQINKRGEDHYNGKESEFLYNEMVFKKLLDGEIKQPDYILVFKEDGKIENFEEAKKASKSFGNIPIVIIDKDKCGEHELNQVKQLIEKYKSTKDKNTLKLIKLKIRNNLVSNKYFKTHLNEIEAFIQTINLHEQDKYVKQNIDGVSNTVKSDPISDVSERTIREMTKIEDIYDKIRDVEER